MQPNLQKKISVWRPPYVFSLGFVFSNALTWMVALGTPLLLLCQELGASPLQIGLVSAFPMLMLPLQVLATALLPYLGYKRQSMLGWSIRAVFLLVPLGIVIAAPAEPAPWMLPALMIAMLGFAIFRAMGMSVTFPWTYAILPEGLRGRYFATEQFVMGVSGLFIMLLSAWVIKALPIYSAFTALYVLTMIGSISAVSCLHKLPDAPAPKDMHAANILRNSWPLVRMRGPFRSYLFLMVSIALFNTSLRPFTVYYLRGQTDVSDSHIFLLVSMQVFGGIVMASITRRFADRIGVRPLLLSAQIVTAGVCLFWLILVLGAAGMISLLPLVYFAMGSAESLLVLGNLKYTPQLSNDNDRAFVCAVLGALAGICGGVAPILWGWFLKDAQGQSINVARFAGFFACNLVLQLALIPRFARLREKDPLPRFPFRWMSSAFGFDEKK
jgi:hypothetical protein